MPHSDDQPSPLSVYRAFVVQFDTYTDVERGHLAGRVEHVVSGQAVLFHSLTRHLLAGLDHGVGRLAYIPTKNSVTRGVIPQLRSV